MEAASQKLQTLDTQSVAFKVLNAMLHGTASFPDTQQIVLCKINAMETQKELEELAKLFDRKFLKPFLSKGGRATSNSSPSQAYSTKGGIRRKQIVRVQVRERDENKCVLTGQSDFYLGTRDRKGFEVAHIIPHSLSNSRNLHSFIRSLVPWLPEDFFLKIDCCENAIFLSHVAHKSFGEFKWFIEMEEHEDSNLNVYRASQVLEDGKLNHIQTGRGVHHSGGAYRYVSSYNQPLYIGVGSIPRPSKKFVLLHELLARIIHMRGGAESLQEDSDDEDSDVEVEKKCCQKVLFDNETVLQLFGPPFQSNSGES